MTTELQAPRSRRAILAATLAAAAAGVANALGRPLPVDAASTGPINIGGTYADVQAQTTLGNSATDDIVLWIASNGDQGHGNGTALVGYSANGVGAQGQSGPGTGLRGISSTGIGVHGTSLNTGVKGEGQFGVWGMSVDGDGVRGDAPSGTGVAGFSTSSTGVLGVSDTGLGINGYSNGTTAIVATSWSPSQPAVRATASGHATAIYGQSSSAGGPSSVPLKTGVFGYAAQDASSRGVVGQTTVGQGVRGLATTGIGVRAFATSGPALSAESTTGYAIQSSGRLSFGKASGVATIASGTKSVVVTPGTDVSTSTFVLATLQGSPGGTTTVQRVATDATNNRFTIYLTANATASVKVAWLVMG